MQLHMDMVQLNMEMDAETSSGAHRTAGIDSKLATHR